MKPLNSLKFPIAVALLAMAALLDSAHADIASTVDRTKVAGIDVIIYRMDVPDMVTISGSLPAGDAFAGDGNVAVPTLVGMMLDKGTSKQDQFQISAKLEKVGAQLGFDVDTQLLNVQGRTLKKDLPMVIGLLAEQLRYPAFSAEELKNTKSLFIGDLRQGSEDPDTMGSQAFSLALYPEGHPNRPHTIEQYLAAVPKATAAQLKAFHSRHYGPDHMTLVFVGDVDAAQIHSELAKAFQGWTGGVEVLRAKVPAGRATQAREIPVNIADKTSTSVSIGQASGLNYRDPDALALRAGTSILGSGFTGRLMSSVRDQEGLTYGIGADVSNDIFTDGTWITYATFAPELLTRGVSSTRRELQKWWQDGVTATELASTKTNMIGRFQVGLSTTNGMAQVLMRAAHLGYDMRWLDEYPSRVEALTLQQVNAAIKKHLNPATMVLVKAGTLDKAPKTSVGTSVKQ